MRTRFGFIVRGLQVTNWRTRAWETRLTRSMNHGSSLR